MQFGEANSPSTSSTFRTPRSTSCCSSGKEETSAPHNQAVISCSRALFSKEAAEEEEEEEKEEEDEQEQEQEQEQKEQQQQQ